MNWLAWIVVFDCYLVNFLQNNERTQSVRNEAVKVFAYSPVLRHVESGAQCGIYSLYAASRALQTGVEIDQFLNRKYIGSFAGSTARELISAAQDMGLTAKFEVGLDVETIRQSPIPLLLQYNLSHQAEGTLHWVTYLGEQNGQARIYDPPREIQLVPYAQLLTAWTGNCIAISKGEPLPSLSLLARLESIGNLWPPIFFCAAIVLIRPCNRLKRLRVQIPLIAVFVLGWCLLSIGTNSYHPLRNRNVTEFLRCRNSEIPQPRVDDIPPIGIVLDCRLPADYGRGHISGAISLPVDANFSEWSYVVSMLDKQTPIVAYCQSAQCVWADRVAGNLACAGFKVSVLKGGYEDFVRKHEIGIRE